MLKSIRCSVLASVHPSMHPSIYTLIASRRGDHGATSVSDDIIGLYQRVHNSSRDHLAKHSSHQCIGNHPSRVEQQNKVLSKMALVCWQNSGKISPVLVRARDRDGSCCENSLNIPCLCQSLKWSLLGEFRQYGLNISGLCQIHLLLQFSQSSGKV